MLALVTGASGFVGSHLVAALIAAGWRVRRLARPASPPAPDARVESRVAPPDDARAIARSGALADVDVVFHVAGVTRAHSAARFAAGNVAPTRALLDAIGEARGGALPRGVLVSSQAAAGAAAAPDRPRTEDDPPAPVGAYGASKRAAEEVVAAHAAGGARWTVVRPCAVFGARDRDFLPLFRQATRGVALLPGTRDAWLSLVHAPDLARALVLAGTAPGAAGRTYFVAGEEAVPWPAVAAAVARAAGAQLRLVADAPRWALTLAGAAGDLWSAATGRDALAGREKLALARPRYWCCSAARARAELGWTPALGLDEAVAATYAWYREAGWM